MNRFAIVFLFCFCVCVFSVSAEEAELAVGVSSVPPPPPSDIEVKDNTSSEPEVTIQKNATLTDNIKNNSSITDNDDDSIVNLPDIGGTIVEKIADIEKKRSRRSQNSRRNLSRYDR